jgi:fatty acid desaturase
MSDAPLGQPSAVTDVPGDPAAAVRPSPAGYAALGSELRELGLMKRRPGYYAGLAAGTLTALAVLIAVMFLLRDSWWLLLLAPAYAVVSTQTAFLGHDAAHRQVARGPRNSALIGLLLGNLLNGLSFGWWVAKHNAHHAHPNDLDSDPDVAPGAFVFDPDQATTRTGTAAWLTRHQAWLFFPMLLLEAANLHMSSLRAVAIGGLRYRRVEIALLVTHFCLYAALLAATMTWQQIPVFVAIHQGLFGLYLGCSFAPSHKGMPSLSAEQAADPLLRQVLTSRNIRGGAFVSGVLGGLNLQIEHHLFPSMPRCNLRKAQPFVRAHCEREGIDYMEVGLFHSYAIVVDYLNNVGLRARDPFDCPLSAQLRG